MKNKILELPFENRKMLFPFLINKNIEMQSSISGLMMFAPFLEKNMLVEKDLIFLASKELMNESEKDYLIDFFRTEKKHAVIPLSMMEVRDYFGGMGICDDCGEASIDGYFIPVLGSRWYCKKCFVEWQKDAKFYKEDGDYEKKVFNRAIKIIKKYHEK